MVKDRRFRGSDFALKKFWLAFKTRCACVNAREQVVGVNICQTDSVAAHFFIRHVSVPDADKAEWL